MILALRNSTFFKYFWVFTLVYMVNISVDSVDPIQYLENQAALNDQESIVELVLEKVLGIENAIEEKQDTDSQNQESNNSVKHKFETFHSIEFSNLFTAINSHHAEHLHHYKACSLSDGFLYTITPPPKT